LRPLEPLFGKTLELEKKYRSIDRSIELSGRHIRHCQAEGSVSKLKSKKRVNKANARANTKTQTYRQTHEQSRTNLTKCTITSQRPQRPFSNFVIKKHTTQPAAAAAYCSFGMSSSSLLFLSSVAAAALKEENVPEKKTKAPKPKSPEDDKKPPTEAKENDKKPPTEAKVKEQGQEDEKSDKKDDKKPHSAGICIHNKRRARCKSCGRLGRQD
jgi:hypothetical protein